MERMTRGEGAWVQSGVEIKEASRLGCLLISEGALNDLDWLELDGLACRVEPNPLLVAFFQLE